MRHTLLPLSITLVCLAVTPALADGVRVKKSAAAPSQVQTSPTAGLLAPQSSVVVSLERGVRVWRPVTVEGESTAYPQAAAGYGGGEQPASSYAPRSYGGGYGGYGIGGFYGAGVGGVNGRAQARENLNGDGFQQRAKVAEAVPQGQPHVRGMAPKPNKPMVHAKPGGDPKPMVHVKPGGDPKPMVHVARARPELSAVHYGHRPMPKVMVSAKPSAPHAPMMHAPMPGRMAMGGGGMRAHPMMAHARHR